MQQVNAHHLEKHKPQICPVCGHTFALASSLIRHAYDHEEKCYKCETCNYSAHFESELNAHKNCAQETTVVSVHGKKLWKVVPEKVGTNYAH